MLIFFFSRTVRGSIKLKTTLRVLHAAIERNIAWGPDSFRHYIVLLSEELALFPMPYSMVKPSSQVMPYFKLLNEKKTYCRQHAGLPCSWRATLQYRDYSPLVAWRDRGAKTGQWVVQDHREGGGKGSRQSGQCSNISWLLLYKTFRKHGLSKFSLSCRQPTVAL